MSEQKKDDGPLLAALVNAGADQTEAVAITDFIFMARDASNAYLVTTADGDVLINTGFPPGGERNKRLLDAHRTGPLRYIILTQSHPDHYGNVPLFKEPGTKIIAEGRYAETDAWYRRQRPAEARRGRKLWAFTKVGGELPPMPLVIPDIEVDRRYDLEVGGRRFEILSTEGGETLDSLTVWMPDEKIAFVGNLFGPVFLSAPNLNTLRGDKPRSVLRYLKSLDLVRNLDAEILITGHQEPIRGARQVRADIDKMYDAMSYISEAVIDGMNAGDDVYALMRNIELPEHLKLGQYHGNIRWAVRSIFHEYQGWFLGDSTTSLYGVPRSSIDADLVELAGGAQNLVSRAKAKLTANQPLEAIHLLDVALGADPANRDGMTVKIEALERLLADWDGQNLSENGWLRSEIASTRGALEPAGA